MNITLPEPLAKKMDKLENKSAFIARALVERLKALEKSEKRRTLVQGYRDAMSDPEYVREELKLIREMDGVAAEILDDDEW